MMVLGQYRAILCQYGAVLCHYGVVLAGSCQELLGEMGQFWVVLVGT